MTFRSNWQRIGHLTVAVVKRSKKRSVGAGSASPSVSQGEAPNGRRRNVLNNSSEFSSALPLQRGTAKPDAARRLRRLTAARVHRNDSRG